MPEIVTVNVNFFLNPLNEVDMSSNCINCAGYHPLKLSVNVSNTVTLNSSK